MPIANVCCGLLFLLLIRVPDTVFAGKHIVIRDLFNGIMSRLPDSCPGLNFYTYDSLLKASDKFPGFGTTGSSDDAKRELAAFLAHAAHETAGFCYVEEVNPRGDYCDESNAKYPCVPGKSYHGRGPLQLSWNYNYGAAGNYLELDVLNKPEIVAMNSTESFMTAVWFWMVDTSCHSAITSGQGFGVTIEAINSQECGGGNPVAVHSRIKYFKSYCQQLGVDPGSNLHCSSTPLQLGRSMKAYHRTNCIESPSTAPGVTTAYCQVAKTPAPTTDAIEGIQPSFQVPRHNQTSASANITVTVGKPTTNVASPVPSYIVAAPAPADGTTPRYIVAAPAPADGTTPTVYSGSPMHGTDGITPTVYSRSPTHGTDGITPTVYSRSPGQGTDGITPTVYSGSPTDSVPPHVTQSKRKSKHIAMLLGIIGGSAVVISIACLFFIIRGHCRTLSIIIQRRKRYTTDGELAVTEESAFVRFDYEVLKDATKNFDSKNELGEGGFGKVYKGTLSNGTDIAVKKLFVRKNSQAMDEFLTEIKLISKVRHRNLVRLLGYCTKGHEQLLVYEFMPNGSLDKHLFRGHDTRNFLNWKARFEIIVGTAHGLAYLHEYSHARIIHRDIKAANILLDQKCHPKIADFGLARLFPEDQSHVSTGVGGTIGYMAPEYAVHGHLSEKADIYSYGVVVLEIVSGRRCKNSSLPAHMELLLEWAWSLYERDESMEIVDANLEGTYQREEVSRVIQIAFLCTQGSSNMRPSMSNVVSMLTSNSKNMVKPTQPAFINANNRSVPIIAVVEPVPSQRPPPTSHGSISLSFTPR